MATKVKHIAYDFDGVVSEGLFQDGAIILTGESEDAREEILEVLGDLKAKAIHHFPYGEDLDNTNVDVKIGIWKAKMLKSLGIEKFYEDSEDQIQIIKELAPNVEIIKVIDGVPQEQLNFIIFTFDGTILPIAEKLEKEGNRVVVGVIHDKKDVLLPNEEVVTEDPDKKKQRLSVYDGIVDKYPATELLKMMKRIKDKENWIILTDSNCNFKFTTLALEMGFTKGMFPLEKDRELECDRKLAKDFVKEHYPDVKVAEVKKFDSIEEGMAFLKETEELWVLKGIGDSGDTVCPQTEDVEMATAELTAKLEEMKDEYEENGFILEPRILEPIELTPEIMFVDGLPIFTSLDIEIKNISAGSSVQTGCMANLVVKTEMKDRINEIAFPEKVMDMAKERTGMFVWDISLLIDKKGTMWFGEFCSQRFGWDSFPTELAMSGDDEGSKIVTPFFASLLYKKNPLRSQFGIGVRLLNIGAGGKVLEGSKVEILNEAVPDVYLYEVKKANDEIVSTASSFDFGVVTGVDDELYKAIDKCYNYVDMVMFEGKYYRPKFDFMSYEYPQSIMRRYQYATSMGLIGSEEGQGRELPVKSMY